MYNYYTYYMYYYMYYICINYTHARLITVLKRFFF